MSDRQGCDGLKSSQSRDLGEGSIDKIGVRGTDLGMTSNLSTG